MKLYGMSFEKPMPPSAAISLRPLGSASPGFRPSGARPNLPITSRMKPQTPGGSTAGSGRLRPASSVVTPPAPAPATDGKLGPSADQNNLANSAQRLEAVMRRP